MPRTKLQEIENMYNWVIKRSPSIRWDYALINKLISTNGNQKAKGKCCKDVILSLRYNNPFFYIICHNGEDEYGHGDYNTETVNVENKWGKNTEKFLHELLTMTVMKYTKPQAEQEILSAYNGEIQDRATRLMRETRKNQLTSVK